MKISKLLMLSAAIAGAFSAGAIAKPYPAGTQLATTQEITLNNGAEVTSIDPAKQAAEPAFNLGRDLFEGLTIQDKTGKTIPGIASSWTVNDDNTVYTFSLRNAHWSNGDPVTAQDFVYSWQRLLDPKTASPYAWFAAIPKIKNSDKIMKGEASPQTMGVRAIDAHTFEVTLEQSVPFFIKLLSHPVLAPVHQATVEKYASEWTQPQYIVTNGAFTLSEWKVNEKLVMVKNPHYWDYENVVLEKITWLPIGDANVSLNRYLAGDIDEALSIPAAQKKKLLKEYPQQVANTSASLGSRFYYLNTQKGPTQDVRVRKALSYAIDRNILTKAILKNGGIPMYTLVPPQTDGFTSQTPEFANWNQKQRNDKAKALLAEAGYGKDKQLKLTFTLPTFSTDVKVATAMVGMWKSVLGAQVEIKQLEPKVFYALKDPGNISRGGWTADYNEASTWLDLFVSTGEYNDSRYNNPKYDQLMADSKVLDDPSQEYLQAEALLLDDMAIIPVYRPGNDQYLRQPYIGGYERTNPESSYYRKNVYVKAH
ncbi:MULTISPECIES: peptide ABC transporter substrate-binding protein [unclassified Vibrio]|uniref:peptide ABC transporter substrate-binding protein n=1 Tax=unclassified Vibrio TaxID=2614977 RepID=UPI001361EA20|nr:MULTISPECIES: peptide ABC transporter substrate-binding protein [unclassified Vibrio]NAW58224.1 peptide ABC transporter substrate-binding protein [Vibrio sp. V36_P2S2PM302]NAX23973.1 peptide ABC transporter substrate-binding protein [Vibrio sp. V38_P2S17PM301]NAX29788.1 peptide ABC transporter substrate-binding protein [Vibrio sp. V37_P2S8PM304]